jgi:flagellin
VWAGFIAVVDGAIADVSESRANLGAVESDLNHASLNLGVAWENTVAANSRIRDADLALESVNQNRNLVLQQASTAAIAHGNLEAQTTLALYQWPWKAGP